jgi:predicted RecA/RadA family phage recombinase
MATRDNYNGVFTLTAPTGGVTAGTMKVIQGVVCLPEKTVAAGVTFPAVIWGRVKAAPAAGTATWTAGQKLYWVTASAHFSTAATGNVDYGVRAAADKASAATTGDIILHQA